MFIHRGFPFLSRIYAPDMLKKELSCSIAGYQNLNELPGTTINFSGVAIEMKVC